MNTLSCLGNFGNFDKKTSTNSKSVWWELPNHIKDAFGNDFSTIDTIVLNRAFGSSDNYETQLNGDIAVTGKNNDYYLIIENENIIQPKGQHNNDGNLHIMLDSNSPQISNGNQVPDYFSGKFDQLVLKKEWKGWNNVNRNNSLPNEINGNNGKGIVIFTFDSSNTNPIVSERSWGSDPTNGINSNNNTITTSRWLKQLIDKKIQFFFYDENPDSIYKWYVMSDYQPLTNLENSQIDSFISANSVREFVGFFGGDLSTAITNGNYSNLYNNNTFRPIWDNSLYPISDSNSVNNPISVNGELFDIYSTIKNKFIYNSNYRLYNNAGNKQFTATITRYTVDDFINSINDIFYINKNITPFFNNKDITQLVITYFSELITSSVNIESVSIHVNVQRNVNDQLYNMVIKINNLQVNDVNTNAFVNVFADNLKISQTLININIVQDESSVIITIGISN